MAEILNLGVERDHIEAMTRASGTTALAELIWNSLDADASEIRISWSQSKIGGYQEVVIEDNGHGLPYEKAKLVFSKLGGSDKKTRNTSPNGREYHGKEGRGRYKSLALGDLVEFVSVYKEKGRIMSFSARIDQNQLSRTELDDPQVVSTRDKATGFRVIIHNVNDERAEEALRVENRKDIAERFASYWITYQNFHVLFAGAPLDFKSLIKHQEEKAFVVEKDDKRYKFTAKVIEWSIDTKKKAYLCNKKGIPFDEVNLGIRPAIPVSLFLQADYIERLHRSGTLEFHETNEILQDALKQAQKYTRDYIRRRLHLGSRSFIEDLKRRGLYPYKEAPQGLLEESKRQVFDILALQVNEYLPSFEAQDDASKKLTLGLISQALDHDAKNLRKVLSEFIGLPEAKRDELAELLETTSLSSMIDTMTVIKNRLHFLNGLEQMIYDKDLSAHVKERKHLHKIIVRETWIFGDEYTYGVDDLTLKNVLKAYLKDYLHREDFEEVIASANNDDLQTIPDVCLWQQFSIGSAGKENLVIELKRPTTDAGSTEKGQIEGYAAKVSLDARFPKDKTRWKFILVTRDIKPEIEPLVKQKHRRYGHVSEGENFDVYILTWGRIISEARQRLEYIQEKLNLNLGGNEAGLGYLRDKYKEYLPEDF